MTVGRQRADAVRRRQAVAEAEQGVVGASLQCATGDIVVGVIFDVGVSDREGVVPPGSDGVAIGGDRVVQPGLRHGDDLAVLRQADPHAVERNAGGVEHTPLTAHLHAGMAIGRQRGDAIRRGQAVAEGKQRIVHARLNGAAGEIVIGIIVVVGVHHREHIAAHTVEDVACGADRVVDVALRGGDRLIGLVGINRHAADAHAGQIENRAIAADHGTRIAVGQNGGDAVAIDHIATHADEGIVDTRQNDAAGGLIIGVEFTGKRGDDGEGVMPRTIDGGIVAAHQIAAARRGAGDGLCRVLVGGNRHVGQRHARQVEHRTVVAQRHAAIAVAGNRRDAVGRSEIARKADEGIVHTTQDGAAGSVSEGIVVHIGVQDDKTIAHPADQRIARGRLIECDRA